jgi:hypothetical protein
MRNVASIHGTAARARDQLHAGEAGILLTKADLLLFRANGGAR